MAWAALSVWWRSKAQAESSWSNSIGFRFPLRSGIHNPCRQCTCISYDLLSAIGEALDVDLRFQKPRECLGMLRQTYKIRMGGEYTNVRDSSHVISTYVGTYLP